MQRNVYHECEDDEDLAFIAHRYGFGDWKPIEEHEKNKELWTKEGRTAHLLRKGDKVWIPDITPKVFECRTNQAYTFVLPSPKMLLNTVVQDIEGVGCGNLKYEVWVDGRRAVPATDAETARTRADGLVHQLVPLSKEVELRVWFPGLGQDHDDAGGDDEEGEAETETEEEPRDEDAPPVGDDDDPDAYESMIIKMAYLAPIGTVEGVQDRLNNIGYDTGADEPNTLGDGTKAALKRFQRDHDLDDTGELDEPTRARLRDVHDGAQPAATTDGAAPAEAS